MTKISANFLVFSKSNFVVISSVKLRTLDNQAVTVGIVQVLGTSGIAGDSMWLKRLLPKSVVVIALVDYNSFSVIRCR